jgi:hypothetical protein
MSAVIPFSDLSWYGRTSPESLHLSLMPKNWIFCRYWEAAVQNVDCWPVEGAQSESHAGAISKNRLPFGVAAHRFGAGLWSELIAASQSQRCALFVLPGGRTETPLRIRAH